MRLIILGLHCGPTGCHVQTACISLARPAHDRQRHFANGLPSGRTGSEHATHILA